MKVTIFGSPYLKQASNFADFAMPFEVGWFEIGWMITFEPFPNFISGGNDIFSGLSVKGCSED